MANDALLVLQASATNTASANSTGIDLKGTPLRGLWANVRTTAISGTAATVTYKIQGSDDNTTYVDLSSAEEGAQTAVGALDIPFTTSKRYVRLVATIAGTTPSVTYNAYVGQGPAAGVYS